MAFQKGVIAFLPLLLSSLLLHHLSPTSVIRAQSDNHTRRLLSLEDDEYDIDEAQCPVDTQTENALQNSDADIQMTQSDPHTSLLLSPTQTQKNVPNDSNNIEVNSDSYIPPFPPTIQIESDVSIDSNLEVNTNVEVQKAEEYASNNDRVLHDEL
ncbi:uncharacterized protein LOC114168512 isoform X2 [Vigna unguiculata]|uniref:uncharacterized protein LOC114168512 isoform X2 n=1 Tax=Vigna unguiculata TaxID=3917 RepID=UPI001015FAA7|nr:uncharacterized protein LOC114168512 isoform X2 [Vigna unguiculata]